MMKKLLATAALTGMLTGGAHAATFHFTSTYNPLEVGTGNVGTYETYTDGSGGSVNVTAGMYQHNGAGNPATFTPGDQYGGGVSDWRYADTIVENGQYGLGLLTDVYGWYDDSHTVDGDVGGGANTGEMLTFDFGAVVELTDVVLGFWNGNDLNIFDLFVDNILVASNISSLAGLSSDLLTGTVFGFGADGDGCYHYCSEDGFKVKALSVTPVSEVPVPAALPLLGAGLLGLGFFGRRRKVTAAA